MNNKIDMKSHQNNISIRSNRRGPCLRHPVLPAFYFTFIVFFLFVFSTLPAKEHKAQPNNDYKAQRRRLVDLHIVKEGIRDPNVIQSMRSVPREEFVPAR